MQILGSYNTSIQGVKEGLTGGISDAIKRALENYNALFNATDKAAKGQDKLADSASKPIAPLIKNAEASNTASKAAEKFWQSIAEGAKALADLQAKIDPTRRAYEDYIKSVVSANEQYEKQVKLANEAGLGDGALAVAKKELTDRIDASYEAFKRENDEIQRQYDVVGEVIRKHQEELSTIGLTG